MARIFLSHSSGNNAEAVALREWLSDNGWKDEIFLDLDPHRGIVAGERWERALNEAANRCEAVLFLVSRSWLASGWCLKEFNLAHKLNKRLFGILIEDIPIADLPVNLTSTWQIVQLAAGRDHVMLRAVMPITQEEVNVTYSAEGLARLKHGLEEAGLDPKYFAWPPQSDPDRAPYRGLRPLEAEDAGIFFGRDGPIVEGLDELRGLRESTPSRLLVILGASGAGKSSFLRAGLLPRLARDDRNFLTVPVIRPEQAAISGDTGLLAALEQAFYAVGVSTTRAKLRAAVEVGAKELAPLLQALLDKATPRAVDAEIKPKPPSLIVSIDQGEELFRAEGREEAQKLLVLLRDLLSGPPALIVLLTIRSDSYGQLQEEKILDGIAKIPFDLSPMPKGSYADVIKGPAQRLAGSKRALRIEDALPDALLTDIEAGGAKDALPLLAFTLERLYVEHGGDGDLTVAEYRSLGGIKGSIEAAVEQALRAADADPAIPRDRAARLNLLRRGLIPWLAGIDPDTGAPRRRVARLSEIPAEARPLIQHLVERRLLATDANKDMGEITIEPAHEALLRQWGLLEGWLTEDAGLLAVLEAVKRGSRDWAANNRSHAWLVHQTDRLAAAKRLFARADLAANLDPTDRAYIAACGEAEADTKRTRRLLQGAVYVSLVGIILGLVGWINQAYLFEQWRWYSTIRPFMNTKIRPHVLTAAAEQKLNPKVSFRECASDQGKDYCPEMIVIPTGAFVMGAPPSNEPISSSNPIIAFLTAASPEHKVTISRRFAVAKFGITFDEWDTCVAFGDCASGISDSGFGRGQRPVINLSWEDATTYVAWLSKMTGKPYRLLTEAEYEYATRAETQTLYPWGDDIGVNNANCGVCGSKWDRRETSPVGSFPPNRFGLYDMVGNNWEWVEDCYHDNYRGAPSDGSAWMTACVMQQRHVIRGGSYLTPAPLVRSDAQYGGTTVVSNYGPGFRVARTLLEP